MKIAIFSFWFGPLPSTFEMWLKSVSHNQDFDFYFYTDQDIPYQVPSNMVCKKITLDWLRDSFSEKLGHNVQLSYSYKLCDYRPAYGFLFADTLKDYTHWGYCDIDLLFGNISKFLTPAILNDYNKIFHRGHFSVYRNTEYINTLFAKTSYVDYKKIFLNPNNCLFDEWRGISRIFKVENLPVYHKELMADIDYKAVKFRLMNEKNYEKQLFVYENGGVYQYFVADNSVNKKEFVYIHIQKRKLEVHGSVANTDRYVLGARGMLPLGNTILDEKAIAKLNEPNYSHFINRFSKKLRSKLVAKGPVIDEFLKELC